jgi:hypothetical protein
LSYTDQYWLGVNHGNEWNDKRIVPRTQTITQSLHLPTNEISGKRAVYAGPIRVPGNSTEALELNFSNYFGKPIKDVTIDDW